MDRRSWVLSCAALAASSRVEAQATTSKSAKAQRAVTTVGAPRRLSSVVGGKLLRPGKKPLERAAIRIAGDTVTEGSRRRDRPGTKVGANLERDWSGRDGGTHRPPH